MTVHRTWATPLTLGAFSLMALTGGLMFFHGDRGLNRTAHEWLGWLFIAAVGAHALANQRALLHHIRHSRVGRGILLASALAIAGSFVRVAEPGEGAGARPPMLAMQAIANAPLRAVAALQGRSVAQLQTQLAAVGLTVPGPQQSIAELFGADRQAQDDALRAVLGVASRH